MFSPEWWCLNCGYVSSSEMKICRKCGSNKIDNDVENTHRLRNIDNSFKQKRKNKK